MYKYKIHLHVDVSMYNINDYLNSGRTYKVHFIKIVHLPMFSGINTVSMCYLLDINVCLMRNRISLEMYQCWQEINNNIHSHHELVTSPAYVFWTGFW